MLSVVGVTKRFGDVTVLDGVDLEVAGGEVVALLGPSGSGKSTLLRIVAGLEAPGAGTVHWDGEDLGPVPAHRRRFGLMFQSYALFPHRSVADNVGFGLRMEGLDRSSVRRRVDEVLGWVGLDGFGRRPVDGLSGGEQQRVALARTLAPDPRLVMLDEPLGALDRDLRERLVGEIRHLLERRGTAALYVTHDHEEAATVADRLAVIRAGRILQTGTLSELRRRPVDQWVGEFVRA